MAAKYSLKQLYMYIITFIDTKLFIIFMLRASIKIMLPWKLIKE